MPHFKSPTGLVILHFMQLGSLARVFPASPDTNNSRKETYVDFNPDQQV
jgi:hypothetical protein